MSRVEVIGDATLYLGDCMDILPTLPKVDAVVSDPPYGIGYLGSTKPGKASTTGKHLRIPVHGDDKPFDPAPFLGLGVCAFTGAQHFAERLPGGSFHVWNKRLGYEPIAQADGDLIWVSGEKRALRIVDMLWRGLCRHVEREDLIEHPTQKPVALMRWIIEKAGSPALIFDPYMGSGSTGVAAIQAGLQFIGCEIDSLHFATACRRIEQAYKQRPLFDAEPAQAPEQLGIGLEPA